MRVPVLGFYFKSSIFEKTMLHRNGSQWLDCVFIADGYPYQQAKQ